MSKTHIHALGADGDLPADAFQPYARGRMRLHKGGGGSKNYKNLEVLYGEQAESARLLREQAEKNLPGMVDAYVGRSKQFLDPGYAERQADQAAADMASSNAMQRADDAHERMWAFFLKDFGRELFIFCAFLAGGFDHMRSVSMAMRRFFTHETYDMWEHRYGIHRAHQV